jgi:hypothetical protein
MDGKLKGAMAVAIAVGLIVGAFPALVSNPGFAKAAQSNVSVNRATKGDRLPLKRISAASQAQPPVGCDPAFSRAADPGVRPHQQLSGDKSPNPRPAFLPDHGAQRYISATIHCSRRIVR